MKRLFSLFLLIPLLLKADWDNLFSDGDDPSLFHHVNVISGNLVLCMQDVVVNGAVPISLMRMYSSTGALDNSGFDSMHMRGGWDYLPYINLLIEPYYKKEGFKAFLAEPNGNVIPYNFSHKENDDLIYLKPNQNLSKTISITSARNNPYNNYLCLNLKSGNATLYLPNGGLRTYKGQVFYKQKYRAGRTSYKLVKEILPSKHELIYSYDDKARLIHIASTNPGATKTYSWVHFDYLNHKPPLHFQANTSDGKTLNYRSLEFKETDYICNVESNCRPQESFGYGPGRKGIGTRVQGLILGGIEQFTCAYFSPPNAKIENLWRDKPHKKDFSADKIRVLEAPIGPNGEKRPVARFSYTLNRTEVRDTENLLIRYHHKEGRLVSAEYFNENDNLSSVLKLLWDNNRLRCKAMLNEHNQALFAKTFYYDDTGNIIEEVLSGNLTGAAEGAFTLNNNGTLSNAETYRKRYSYSSKLNLPLTEEEEGGVTSKYTYKEDTDLLTSKLVSHQGKILTREFRFYDEDNILTNQMVDDGFSENLADLTGVTERHIVRYEVDSSRGLPVSKKELYLDLNSQKEILITKTFYTYGSNNLPSSEAVHDAHEKHRYTIHINYDSQGRITRKTTPLGQENLYSYDILGNVLEAKEVGASKKRFVYDAASRLKMSEENQKATHNTYDSKGRVLTQTDHKGNITKQTYDCFGRCLETRMPNVKDEQSHAFSPSIQFGYDLQGNLVFSKAPKGETTKTSYNTLGKPIRIIHPDDSEIHHRYNKNGTLAQTIYSEGTETHYTYDPFQRITSQITYSKQKQILSKEIWSYNSFRLLSYTNSEGLTTTFNYDGAGRKTAEEAMGRKIIFTYDSLGFLEKTTRGDISYIEKYDIEGKVLEKWEEGTNHNIENYTLFFYDNEGRKIKALRKTSQGESIDHFTYDEEGRLITHKDPLNNLTQFLYSENVRNDLNQKILQKTTIDPLGNRSLDTYDACNRIVLTEQKNPEGRTCSKEEVFYDKSGNKSKRISTVYERDTPIKAITVAWEYDLLGRVIKEIEAEGKITHFFYDTKGRLVKRTLPSGISLFYSYDGLDRLLELKSSNEEIHYQYFYGENRNPIEIHDLIQKTKLLRTYNSFGELIEETNPLGFTYRWEYDLLGRCTLFALPDMSSIRYSYTGAHLTSVSRYSSQDDFFYTHEYSAFDPNGHVVKENLIYNIATTQTAHDLLERPIYQECSYMTNKIAYGPSGLVLEVQSSLLGNKRYAHDPLNQLTEEGTLKYHFDSLGNPLDGETNNKNELLSTSEFQLIYDLNGNPLQKISEVEKTNYTYDPLGRLTSITQEGRKVRYIYDPFSRLLAKEIYIYTQNDWQKLDNVLYLYDRDYEIGVVNEQKQILQLKVLGLGLKGDIGAAIALELNGVTYAPLHDFFGNITSLINPDGSIAEINTFTAFGKELTLSPLSPWRFCSKRLDEGLIFFGKWFYDPSLGRWLTPDPMGFADGPNLYAYAHNSPTNRLDLFGLNADLNFPLDLEIYLPPITRMLDANGGLRCQINQRGPHPNPDAILFSKTCLKLLFTPEELRVGKVNMSNHFIEVMPQEGKTFGLITLQNGIFTSLRELSDMGKSIFDKIPEGTLLVCLHNKCLGVGFDSVRVQQEMMGVETPVIIQTRQFMVAIASTLDKINPNLLWLHIAHSEGGLIEYRAIEGMTPEEQQLMKKHLYSFAAAPAHPIPIDFANYAVNVYSSQDDATRRHGMPFLDNPNYDIQILQCITNKKDWTFWVRDHGFMKATLQKAVSDQIDDLRTKVGFHENYMR